MIVNYKKEGENSLLTSLNFFFCIAAILIIILLSSTIVCADNLISSSNTPLITINFNSNVIVNNATIYCNSSSPLFCPEPYYEDPSIATVSASLDEGTIYVQDSTDGLNSKASYEVTTPLYNQEYTIKTEFEDPVGNEGELFLNFEVDAEAMSINITEPEYGCSNSSQFDVVIETENASDCWYNFVLADSFYQSRYDLEKITDLNETDGRTIHRKNNFTEENNFEPNRKTSLYVTCKRDSDESYSFKYFNLMWDETYPDIDYNFDNSTIYIQDFNNRYFDVIADSNSDNIACEIKKIIDKNNDYSGTYQVFDTPAGINISDPWSYETNNEIRLNYNTITDYNLPFRYKYEIRCRNRAQLFDEVKTLNILINLSSDFDIIRYSPDDYTRSPADFNFGTSIDTDKCVLINATDAEFDMTNVSKRNYTLSKDLSEGNHDFEIKCEAIDNVVTEAFSFTVDSTAPTGLSIDSDSDTCSLSEIEFSLSADDSISGIDYFEYTISNSSGEIESGILDEDDADNVDVDIDLVENATYTISAKVYDRAGNSAGPVSKDVKATPSDLPSCDTTDPTIIFETEEQTGVTYLNISCADDKSGCQENYNYDLLSNITEDCNYSQEASFSSSGTYTITEKTKACVRAYDNNNNQKEASRIIDVQFGEHCSNGMLDEDETDVDCGGSCPACPINDSCINNSDCSSGWCDNGTCQSATCEDGIQNQQESDIDCGGPNCPDCGINSSCVNDSDCSSGWCDEGVCHTSSCNDSIENGFETDVDCGGPDCSPCPDGFKCEEDSDCESGNCDLLYGECAGQGQQDTDEDGMPDDWEDMYGLDKNDPSDAEEDKDDDGFTNLEEYLNGTDPTVSDKESSVIPLILLILGILLVAGGTGYLIYYTKTKKKLSPEPEQTLNKPKKVQKPKISKEKLRELKKKRERMSKRFKTKMKKSRSKISSKLSPFDEFNTEVEDEVKKKIGKEALAQKKKEELEEKETPKKSVRLDEGIDKEYLEVSDLEKSAKKQKAKSRKEGGIGSSVFEKLKDIEKESEKEREKNEKDAMKRSEGMKEYVTEEKLRQLDKLIAEKKKKEDEKEKHKTKSSGKDKKDVKAKKRTKELADTEEDKAFEEKDKNILKPKKDEDIREEAGNIFAELEDIANKKYVDKNKKDLFKEPGLDSEDLIDMFKDKEININAFKLILSELLRTKKLNKNDVSDIIFKLLEQDLVKKDVANKILEELNLVNK